MGPKACHLWWSPSLADFSWRCSRWMHQTEALQSVKIWCSPTACSNFTGNMAGTCCSVLKRGITFTTMKAEKITRMGKGAEETCTLYLLCWPYSFQKAKIIQPKLSRVGGWGLWTLPSPPVQALAANQIWSHKLQTSATFVLVGLRFHKWAEPEETFTKGGFSRALPFLEMASFLKQQRGQNHI